jgi:hypothetical protein
MRLILIVLLLIINVYSLTFEKRYCNNLTCRLFCENGKKLNERGFLKKKKLKKKKLKLFFRLSCL